MPRVGIFIALNSTIYCDFVDFNKYHEGFTALSLVNGEPWDMHKPLVEDCDVKFLTFQLDDPTLANQVQYFDYIQLLIWRFFYCFSTYIL